MKTYACLSLAIFSGLLIACGQTGWHSTNDVPITEGGMRLILTDQGSAPLAQVAKEDELHADAPLYWVLHNTSSNEFGLLFLGCTNAFAFEVKAKDGGALQKTAAGSRMGEGPKSLTDPYRSRAFRVGPWPGGIQYNDFPRLTELVHFPSNGTYLLELRCWVWSASHRRFVRSAPIRHRVIAAHVRTGGAEQGKGGNRKGVAH